MRSGVRIILFVSCLVACRSAYAYLDPGSVSLAIQAIVAALAGAAITWKHWYWRLRDFLRMNGKRKVERNDSERDQRARGNEDPPPRE